MPSSHYTTFKVITRRLFLKFQRYNTHINIVLEQFLFCRFSATWSFMCSGNMHCMTRLGSRSWWQLRNLVSYSPRCCLALSLAVSLLTELLTHSGYLPCYISGRHRGHMGEPPVLRLWTAHYSSTDLWRRATADLPLIRGSCRGAR